MSSSQSNITFQLRVASMTTCALPENGSKESSNRAVVVAHPAGTQGLAARVLNHEVVVSFVVIDTNMVRVGLGVPPVPSSVTTHGDPTSIFFAPGQPVNVVPTGDPPNPPPPAPGRSAPASPKRSSHRSGLSLKPTAFMPPPLLAGDDAEESPGRCPAGVALLPRNIEAGTSHLYRCYCRPSAEARSERGWSAANMDTAAHPTAAKIRPR
jgi:hypothetical protein